MTTKTGTYPRAMAHFAALRLRAKLVAGTRTHLAERLAEAGRAS